MNNEGSFSPQIGTPSLYHWKVGVGYPAASQVRLVEFPNSTITLLVGVLVKNGFTNLENGSIPTRIE